MSQKDVSCNTDPCFVLGVRGIARVLSGKVCLITNPRTRFTLEIPTESATEICAACTTRRLQDSELGRAITDNTDEHVVGLSEHPLPRCKSCVDGSITKKRQRKSKQERDRRRNRELREALEVIGRQQSPKCSPNVSPINSPRGEATPSVTIRSGYRLPDSAAELRLDRRIFELVRDPCDNQHCRAGYYCKRCLKRFTDSYKIPKLKSRRCQALLESVIEAGVTGDYDPENPGYATLT
ncbi:hypothetical protein QAD02_013013 [Eretmocerus hayati]|uniref:Uncharacterized protein n=1 Tax=Eretmocerus hayati TaxID=131215 RepID=A0ACC2P1D0_9HYME|nr:hypothetical protein QAD02_013013 [Eretmocerus hayati]